MVKLKEICQFLDNELRIKDIPDSSLNGLQIEGNEDIKRIGFGVDGSFEVFNKAKEAGCGLVIVHHGIFWDNPSPITGILYKRLKILIENGIALYAVHLPLDLNPKFGNNISLINLFDPSFIEPFGRYQGIDIGFKGRLKEALGRGDIVKILDKSLNTSSRILPFGKERIETIAVVTGGGCDCVKEALQKKVDLFITGEERLFSFHQAKEGNLNIVFSGHYATETLGIKGLMEEVKQKFPIPSLFIGEDCWI